MRTKSLTLIICAAALGFLGQACDKKYIAPGCENETAYVPADNTAADDNTDTYTDDNGDYDYGSGYDDGGGCYDSCGSNHPLKRDAKRDKISTPLYKTEPGAIANSPAKKGF